jgi:hypothetical protein
MNLALIKSLKRRIMGESRPCIGFQVPREDMDAIISLTLRGIPVNPRNTMLLKMRCSLESMSRNDIYKPFCECVYNMLSGSVNCDRI